MIATAGFWIDLFIGKGGVGKTTCAAAYALRRAEEGKEVLIISLDPAHNLGDVLKVKLSEEPKEVVKNLHASEVDFDRMIRKYMESLAKSVKDMYGYLKIFNLEGYVDTLKYSPGIEEHATLEKIKEVLQRNEESGKYDVIVFDTPPTGLTVRMLALPKVTSVWLEKLIDLRLAILGRRKMLQKAYGESLKVRVGDKYIEVATEPEDDPIYRELTEMLTETRKVQELLSDQSATSVTIVVNPEVLPVLEAVRAAEALRNVGIPLRNLVINKVLDPNTVGPALKEAVRQQEEAIRMVEEKFSDLNVFKIPLMPWEPVGLDRIRYVGKYLSPLR